MTALGLLAAAGPLQAGSAEPAPELRVGAIELQRNEIFTEQEMADSGRLYRLLRRTMNKLHVDTRAHVLRRELLFREDEPYRPELLAETERNLRALGFLADVSVAAVDTTADGRVNVRVVTQETWTLETSVSYSLGGGGSQRWSVQLSENNFLGRGVSAGGGVGENEDSTYWNLWYAQRRLLQADLTLNLQYARREDGEIARASVGRPFYALDDASAIEVAAWNSSWENRIYLSNAGPAGYDPAQAQSLYVRVPYRDRGVELAAQLRVSPAGTGRVWRLGAGLRVNETRFAFAPAPYELSDGRYADVGWLLDDGQPVARQQGSTVFPHFWLRTVGRAWVKQRYLLQYGPIEDVPLAWDLDVKVGPAGDLVGSTAAWGRPRWRVEAAALKWRRLLGGHAMLLAVAEAETGDRQVRNYVYDVVGGWMGRTSSSAPWLLRAFAEYGQGHQLSGTQALVLGLDRGLRTLEYDGMAGDRLLRWNVEVGRATRWTPAGLFRLGLGAYYGGGYARWRDETRRRADVPQELGLGLRFGPIRSARSQIARVDFTVDTRTGSTSVTAATGGYF
jgi:hypothetical protein